MLFSGKLAAKIQGNKFTSFKVWNSDLEDDRELFDFLGFCVWSDLACLKESF